MNENYREVEQPIYAGLTLLSMAKYRASWEKYLLVGNGLTAKDVTTVGFLSASWRWSNLEAAIGIEPMNKGFAVSARLFAQVQPCLLVSILLGFSAFRVCVRSPKFGSISTGSDTGVIQEESANR